MPLDAIVVNKSDNVATAVRPLTSGQSVHIDTAGGAVDVVLLKAIPFGHKFALRGIKRDERIIKYGEEVGQATVDIDKGDHVHVHNVDGLRGRGDKA